MYEDLVKRLRAQAEVERFFTGEEMLYSQAADAIEELSKRVPPVPHGRLIDADALVLRVNMHGTNKFGMLDEDIRQFIDYAPTIVPAEEGE